MSFYKNTRFKVLIKLLTFSLSMIFFTNQVNADIDLTKAERKWIKENPIVKFTGDPNWLPYEAFNEDGSYIGIVAEHLKLIEELTGLNFNPIPVSSWTESLEIASHGQVSVISGDAADVILNKRFKSIDAYSKNPIVIIMETHQNYVADLNEIKNKKIAIVKDYGYTSDIFKYYPDIKFIEVENVHKGIEGVSSGQFDAMLATIALATYTISDMGVNNVKVVGKTKVVMELTLFVDKNKPILHSIINKALKSISLYDSNEISQRWVKQHYIERMDYNLVIQISVVAFILLMIFFIWNRRLSREIELRIKIEKINKENEERYRTLAKVSPVGIFRTNSKGECIYVNERWCELAGMTEDNAYEEGWANALHPGDRERVFSEWIKAIETNIIFKTECRFKRPDGEISWLLAVAEAEYDNNNTIIGYVGAVTDISELKSMESSLFESETLLEKAQVIAKTGHWKLNTVTGSVTGSDELFRIFGFPREQVSLEAFVAVVHPEDKEMDVATIQRGAEYGESWNIKHRLICHDGTEKWVHAVGEAVKDDGGIVVELVGTVQDITKEKLSDIEFEQSNLRFKAMFESIPDAVVYADPERKIRMINKAAIDLFGYEGMELKGKQTKVLYASDHDFKQQGINTYTPDSYSSTETTPNVIYYKNKSGKEFPGETLGTAVKSSNGEILGYLGIVRDITERTLLEEELDSYRATLEFQIENRTSELIKARDEAERANEAKSDFLSSMSHELRTPLNAILGFGQILELDGGNLSKIQQANVQEILDAGHHLLNLINEVLDLAQVESGKLNINMQKVNVTLVLQDCIKLMSSSIEERNIEIVNNLSKLNLFVSADSIRLKQILINLISNAVKYNKESGQLIFEGWVVTENKIRIVVTDTGKGLTENQISRLFNPFERLNVVENIEGTGIGLTITKHLIELMNGTIGVESTPGKGCTFWIELEVA